MADSCVGGGVKESGASDRGIPVATTAKVARRLDGEGPTPSGADGLLSRGCDGVE